jgi:hypothetical protein
MELISALAAAGLVGLPLVVLALRGTRFDPLRHRATSRRDDRDADARRAAADLAAAASHREPLGGPTLAVSEASHPSAGGTPHGRPAQPASRVSASIAS